MLLIERGRLLLDESADALRGQVVTLTGPAPAVDGLIANADELHRERLGPVVRVTVRGRVEPAAAGAAGVELQPVSLQQLVVRITTASVTDQKEHAA